MLHRFQKGNAYFSHVSNLKTKKGYLELFSYIMQYIEYDFPLKLM